MLQVCLLVQDLHLPNLYRSVMRHYDSPTIPLSEELDLDDVEPTSHGVPLPTKYRKDQVGAPLGVERALKTAPAQSANAFRVPKVIE